MDQQAENVMTERVTGLGRRTRQKMAKWNQMTALRFQTGRDIRHPRLPFGGHFLVHHLQWKDRKYYTHTHTHTNYLLTKNIEEFSGKKFRRMDQQADNKMTERVTGLGRRTRQLIVKWNQMTALRFQTGGRHQTSPASLRGGRGGVVMGRRHNTTKAS